MGREHECRATFNGRTSTGRALLETEELIFVSKRAEQPRRRAEQPRRRAEQPRNHAEQPGGGFRLRIPFKSISKLDATGGSLVVEYGENRAAFAIGQEEAKRWADAIRNPKSRADKLGVKPGQTVALIHVDDDALEGELTARGAVAIKLKKGVDVVFLGANTKKDLGRLAALRDKIASNGAIWVVRPKGVTAITERDVMAAAKDAGLVDVKVVKLSETHTAEKLVIPVAKRV